MEVDAGDCGDDGGKNRADTQQSNNPGTGCSLIIVFFP